jgi:hypothetical protein
MIGTAVRHRVRPEGRLRTVVSAVAAALLVAAGVMLANAGPASARTQHHARAAAAAPTNGEKIPNITLVEDKIEAYYGNVDVHVKASNPIFRYTGDTEHLPSPTSNYAKQMHGIEAGAMTYLHGQSGKSAKPAVVFDIDDTLLNTYNYTVALQFGFTSASNAVFVNHEAFPAVFGMPALVNWAGSHGYTVFFITGRPDTQRRGTVGNLGKVGITVPDGADRLFLKNSDNPPSYLSCGTSCTTIQYKSGTRRHIESMGYHIVGDFGDQFSDLKGGAAQRTFKLPNPMYFLP